MLFNSIEFIVFFSIVFFAYWCLPFRYRWMFLLASSYYFYMSWNPFYIVLILASTCADYVCARGIHSSSAIVKKRLYLVGSLVVNLGLLFSFKYYNFFRRTVESLGRMFQLSIDLPVLTLVLPVGISFYTFQTLSYTIDVYNGKREPVNHFGIFALYVSFFPQLVAGPIERSTRLIPQFFEEIDFDYEEVTGGLKIMVWGLFKKVVIADRLAMLSDSVFNDPQVFTSGFPFWLATYFFAFQIYCDFSGYSDIAIGAAQMMGINLMDNFNRPYFSKTIPEFWRRWHISLSTWFRDYLYIPLGGKEVTLKQWHVNILLVFVVSGLWHGANWTFVVWGLFHGMLYLFYRGVNNYFGHLKDWVTNDVLLFCWKSLSVFICFQLVSISWIFFRANNIRDSFYILNHLFTDLTKYMPGFGGTSNFIYLLNFGKLGMGKFHFFIAIMSIVFLLIIQYFQRHGKMRHFVSDRPAYVRWPLYYVICFVILFMGQFVKKEFIYFQF